VINISSQSPTVCSTHVSLSPAEGTVFLKCHPNPGSWFRECPTKNSTASPKRTHVLPTGPPHPIRGWSLGSPKDPWICSFREMLRNRRVPNPVVPRQIQTARLLGPFSHFQRHPADVCPFGTVAAAGLERSNQKNIERNPHFLCELTP